MAGGEVVVGGEGEGVEGGEGAEGERTELVVEGLDDVPPVDAPVEGEGGSSAEGGDGTDAGTGAGGSSDDPVLEPGAVRIGPITIDHTDDIVSAQKKLNLSLVDQGKGDVQIDLYPYFVAALRGRDFPRDATLMNFDLPTTLNIVI